MTSSDAITKLRLDRGESSRRPRSKRNWLLLLLLFVATAVGAFFLTTATIEVESAAVTLHYPSSSFTLLNASGYVVAQRKAALAAKATGRLDWLAVEEGSRVRKDDVIARLEGVDAEAARRQAVAALHNAQAQLIQAAAEQKDAVRSVERIKALMNHGVISQADFDVAEARESRANGAVAAAEANINAAKAALAGADVAVDYTRIKAPFDGVVMTKNADVGDIVTPLGAAANAKASVVTIADLASLRVEVDVSETNIAAIKVTQPCEITLDAIPQQRFPGRVYSIVPTADRSKATVMVKVAFNSLDPRILPEMSAKVAFLQRNIRAGEEFPLVVIPKAAVIKRDTASYAYLLKGDRAAEVRIDCEEYSADLMVVKSGLKVGDRIALKPLERLKNGAKIKVVHK